MQLDNHLTNITWLGPKVAAWPLRIAALLVISLLLVALAPHAFAADPPPVHTHSVPLPGQQVHSSLAAISTSGVMASGHSGDAGRAPMSGIPPVRALGAETAVEVLASQILILKTASASEGLPGDVIEYTYEVANTGDTPLSNVTVSDDECSPVTRDTYDGDDVLEPAQVWFYTCSRTLEATDADPLVNTATVTAEDPQCCCVECDDTASVDVLTSGFIGDLVWNDRDGDGVHDPDETGLANIVIDLTFDGTVWTTTTNLDGYYEFTGLEAGDYIVDVNDSTIPPGYFLTSVSDPFNVTLGAHERFEDADFGYQLVACLELDKIAPETVVAGEQITYTIVVTNHGPGPAMDVDVKDTLPPGVSLDWATVERSGVGLAACGGTVCQVGDMSAGEVITVTVMGTVDPSVPEGTALDNTGSVFSDTPDEDPENPSRTDTETTIVQTEADLSALKVDLKDPVAPNEGFLYEIEVHNDGPSDAQQVAVTDTLDADVTFVNASPGCSHDSGIVTCQIDTLPAGRSADFLIAVTAGVVPSGTVLINNVEVGSDTLDPNGENNSDTEDTTVQVQPGPSADLAITKTADPLTIIAGQEVTYDLEVTNKGPQVATNVTVFDLVPFGTTVVDLTVDNPDFDDAYCSAGGSCYLGTMEVDTVATIDMVLRVNPDYTGDEIVNVARVSGDQADPNPGDNIASATVDVTQEAHLTIDKFDMVDAVMAGDLILYQIRIENGGPSDAQQVVVTDTVPALTTFVGGSPECSALPDPVVVIKCQLGTIPAGESASVSIQVRVDEDTLDGTVIHNWATVSSPTDPEKHTDDEQTPVYQSHLNPTNLSLDKAGDPESVLAGGTLTYTLVVTNHGPAPATNVVVLDALPDGVTFVSATTSKYPFGMCASGVFCILGQMEIDDTETITIVVDVDPGQRGYLYNAALVSSSNPDSHPEDNHDDEYTEVYARADISVTKTAEPPVAVPGASLSYEIVVTNHGPSDATGVQVTDTLPTNLEGVTWSTAQGSCALRANNVLECALGDVPAGESTVIAVVGTVPSDATDDLVNWVRADSCCTEDENDGNNEVTITTPVSPLADLEILKTATPTVNAGERITYTLAVFNYGPSDAAGVRIVDTLPPDVTIDGPLPSGCGPDTGQVNCGPFNLPSGLAMGLTFYVLAAGDLEPGTSLENVATVEADTPDPVPINDIAYADTSIIGLTDLQIFKTGPITVTAGEEITYTIIMTNAGPGVAHDVDAKDELPDGVSFVSASVERSGSGLTACVSSLCQVGDMAVDEVVTVTVVGLVDMDTEGTIINRVTGFSDTPDTDPTNNFDDHETDVLPGMPTVAIDKRLVSVDLDEHYPNYANFEIIITNVGPTVLDTVPLFDEYDPYYLGFVGASPAQTVPLNPEDADGAVTWHDLTVAAPHGFGENLPPGESFKVTIVFVIEHDITTYTTNLARVENATDVRGEVAPPVEDEEVLIGVPTYIDLLYFRARAEDAFIAVEWETAMEEDVWGFELYRGTTPNFADAEWIHFELSQGGRFGGHYYHYDDADIVSGQTYYYWLATVDSGPSQTTWVIAGPAVSAHFGHRAYLPAIFRR
jgi:uncharacterized repeat protein (TIGR01451 family)